MLTIEADDPIRKKEHQYDQNAPANNFHHPTPMVQTITRILLVLHANHEDSKDGEKQEVTQAHPQYCICLKPLSIRSLVKMIDPFNKIRTDYQFTLHHHKKKQITTQSQKKRAPFPHI